MRWIAAALGIALCFLTYRATAHGPYNDWKTRGGVSCCNDNDCAPATAWQDLEGNWFVRQHGQVYPVPPVAVLPIPSPDGRSHACILGGHVICLVPGEVRG